MSNSSVIAVLANYLIWLFLLVPVYLWVSGKKHMAIKTLIEGMATWVVTLVIKDFFYIPRPFILMGKLPIIGYLLDGSFPSSHTALALGIALSVWSPYRKLALILIFLSILIGLSRVWAGVHDIYDLAGSVVVALGVAISLRAIDTYHSR